MKLKGLLWVEVEGNILLFWSSCNFGMKFLNLRQQMKEELIVLSESLLQSSCDPF